MKVTLEELQKSSLYEFSSESELLESIKKLSQNFVFSREDISEYRECEKLVSAYYQFYFPTNVLKLEEFFERLETSMVEEFKNSDFVDFGCGPGTFSSGLLSYFPDYSKTIHAVDISELMLEQANKSHAHFFPEAKIQYHKNYKNIESDNLTLFFGNSANEMTEDFVQGVIEHLKPKHIIFMEPGTKEAFSQVLNLRKKLIEKGYNSHYPCTSNAACPIEGDTQDWCHQYFKVNYDISIERLSQLLKKDRRNLPVISHLLSKNEIGASKNTIIRSYSESKFGKEFDVCNFDNSKIKIQYLYRGLSKKEQKGLNSILSGESIEFIIDKEISEKFYRVKKSQ